MKHTKSLQNIKLRLKSLELGKIKGGSANSHYFKWPVASRTDGAGRKGRVRVVRISPVVEHWQRRDGVSCVIQLDNSVYGHLTTLPRLIFLIGKNIIKEKKVLEICTTHCLNTDFNWRQCIEKRYQPRYEIRIELGSFETYGCRFQGCQLTNCWIGVTVWRISWLVGLIQRELGTLWVS